MRVFNHRLCVSIGNYKREFISVEEVEIGRNRGKENYCFSEDRKRFNKESPRVCDGNRGLGIFVFKVKNPRGEAEHNWAAPD